MSDRQKTVNLIGLLSAVLIAFQVSLLQILAYMQWYHFASLIIAIAMLGWGSAGTVLTLHRDWLLDRKRQIVPLLLILCALTMPVSVLLIQIEAIRFDTILFFSHWTQPLKFLLTALILMTPFCFGALVLAILFTANTSHISSLYAANMIGSGIGGVLLLLASHSILPEQLTPLLSLLLLLLLSTTAQRRLRFGVFLTMIPMVFLVIFPLTIKPSQFKDIRKTLDLPQATITSTLPSPQGVVHTVHADALRTAPCLSLMYSGPVPTYPILFLNGNMVGPQIDASDTNIGHLYQHAPNHAPFTLQKRRNALVLGDVAGAVHAAKFSESVDLIEPNVTLARLYRQSLPKNITTHAVGARFFLQKKETYDLIILTTPNKFSGTLGLHALADTPLLTLEGIGQCLERLSSTGAISVTWWHDYPPRASLRFLSLVVTCLESEGKNPRDHIRLIQNWGAVTCVITRTSFDDSQEKRLRTFCRSASFDLFPGVDEEGDTPIHQGDSLFISSMNALLKGDRESLAKEYSFRLSPPSDNRPFFHHFLRFSSIRNLRELYGGQQIPLLGMGYVVAALAVVLLGASSLLLILLPLFKMGTKSTMRTLLYFSTIGIGYMFVEIMLIHAFSGYLTSPLYAMSLVITSLLIGSGMGSLFWPLRKHLSAKLPIYIALILLLYALFLMKFLTLSAGIPMPFKIITTLTLTFLPGFFMGGPFPLELKRLSRTIPEQVPWAFGINSCFSVIGASLATLIAVELGFSGLIGIAGGLYLLLLVQRQQNK